MALADILLAETIANSKALAKLEGKAELTKELNDAFFQLAQLAIPVVAAFIAADAGQSEARAARRESQSKMDKMESQLNTLRQDYNTLMDILNKRVL